MSRRRQAPTPTQSRERWLSAGTWLGNVEPVLIKRARRLGYLAKTPEGGPYGIAAVGATESEARANFEVERLAWLDLHSRRRGMTPPAPVRRTDR